MEAQWTKKNMENPSPIHTLIPIPYPLENYGCCMVPFMVPFPNWRPLSATGHVFGRQRCVALDDLQGHWRLGWGGLREHFPYQMQVLWFFTKGKYGKWDNHRTDWNFSAMFDYRRVFTYWTNRVSSVCSVQPTQRLGGKNSRNTHPPHRFHFTCFTLKNLANAPHW